jgi:uncharacterized repeat protein (TIGR03803 family)
VLLQGTIIAHANRNGFLYAASTFAPELPMSTADQAVTITTLASFGSPADSGPSGLITDADGNLLGTTLGGGASHLGTVFEIPKTSSGYAAAPTTLASFNGPNGSYPVGGLITDASGDLFGTTAGGGANGDGTVFEIAKTGSGYATTAATLANFNGPNGSYPVGGLIIDASGALFGTTSGGGASGDGTVFEIAMIDSGHADAPTTLASFDFSDGANPGTGLIADQDGNLFGTTTAGGPGGEGTVFEVTDSGFAPPQADAPEPADCLQNTNGGIPDNSPTTDELISVFDALVSGSVPSGANAPQPANSDSFDVQDLTCGISYNVSSSANAFADAAVPSDSVAVTAHQSDAFIQTGMGSDILTAQAGGDNVLDDIGGAANFEVGGAGNDAYFFDAGRDPVSWNTIVGLHSGDFAAIFGVAPQDVAAHAADGLGAPGYTGLRLRMDAQGGGAAFLTLAGYGTEALDDGSIATAFGTDPASGREYMLIQAS